MKRNGMLVALILGGIIENAQAALPTGATLFDVNLPTLCGGMTLGLTALHWETAALENDYALTFRPFVGTDILIRDDGTYQSILPGSSWGVKIDVGYIFPCTSNNVTLSYIGYHNDSIRVTTLDNFFTGLILPTLSNEWPTMGSITLVNPALSVTPVTLFFPGDIQAGDFVEPNLATAKSNINHNVLDLNFGQSINVGCNTRIKYFGGLRYVNLKDELDVLYNFNNVDTNGRVLPGLVVGSAVGVNLGADFTEIIQQSSNFVGIGPRAGVDFIYHLRWGFGIVGSLSTAMLAGKIDTNLDELFTHLTTAFVFESTVPTIAVGDFFSNLNQTSSTVKYPHEWRFVPNIDAKIGLDYSYQYCNKSHTKVTLEVGYMVSHYFNIVDRVSELRIDDRKLSTRHTIDQHFEGLYLGIQVKV